MARRFMVALIDDPGSLQIYLDRAFVELQETPPSD